MLKRVIQACLLAGLSVSMAASAQTAGWPSKPLKIIVIANPGGFPDIAARTIAPHLSKALGQPVIVENKPGAGGNIATDAVAKAEPDGHTLLLTGSNHPVNQTLLPNPGFDYVKDVAPVSMIAETSLVLISRPSFPANDLAGIAALAKKDPKSLSIAITTLGTPGHLGAELYAKLTGIDFIFVPYTGIAPALNDVMSGQVQLAFASATGVAGLIKSGKLKALVTSGPTRSALLPDVPSAAESGLPGLDVKSWVCLMVTGRTPQPIVQRLNAEVRAIMALPEVRQAFATQGTEPWTTTPEELGALMKADAEKWAAVLKDAKVKR